MSAVRKPTLLKKDSPQGVSYDMLTPEIAAALRSIMREEIERHERQKEFDKLRALKQQAWQLEKKLNPA